MRGDRRRYWSSYWIAVAAAIGLQRQSLFESPSQWIWIIALIVTICFRLLFTCSDVAFFQYVQ
jgi:hypothetical protein